MTKTSERLADFASRLGVNLPEEAQEALPLPQVQEALPLPLRALLRASPETGTAPSEAWLRNQAVGLDLDPDGALARLAHDDLVHTADGMVTAACPYSGTPTALRVLFDGVPQVWAMCAADALGIPLMTGRDGVIFSADPDGGEPIRVERRRGAWSWKPDSAVMLAAIRSGCSSAAEASSPFVNFHVSAERAKAHLGAHPGRCSGDDSPLHPRRRSRRARPQTAGQRPGRWHPGTPMRARLWNLPRKVMWRD